MTSRTVATLEWAAHVSAAASKMHIIGSPVIARSTSRATGAFSAGARLSMRMCSASSTKPRPITTLIVQLLSFNVVAVAPALFVVGVVAFRAGSRPEGHNAHHEQSRCHGDNVEG